MKIVSSVAGVSIRLTMERKAHIQRRHPEMVDEENRILETVAEPDYVQRGDAGTLMAVKHYPRTTLAEKFCVAIYKELDREDGFIVTAYFTGRPAEWREIVWKR